MKKVHIEEAINEIKTNPHFDPRLRWALRDHCENTHQMLLDALKDLHSCHRAFSSNENWTLLDDEARSLAERVIEAASFVKVSE